MLVLIENGHGVRTPNVSPDGTIREGVIARRIAKLLYEKIRRFNQMGDRSLTAELLVPENEDISLKERVNRVNARCKALGSKNVVLVSIHLNASAKKGWDDASGSICIVSPNASNRSKLLAREMTHQMIESEMAGNRSIPNDGYWVQNLKILRDTRCPAVMTENLFMNNHTDVKLLLAPGTLEYIAQYHLDALRNWLNCLS